MCRQHGRFTRVRVGKHQAHGSRHPARAGRTPASSRRDGAQEAPSPRPVPPVLEPRPGGIAERFASSSVPRIRSASSSSRCSRLRAARHRDGRSLGLTLIYVRAADRAPISTATTSTSSRWLADHRTSDQEHLRGSARRLAGGLVIPVVIGLCLLVFVDQAPLAAGRVRGLRHRARVRDLRATSLIVERDRPDVHRLEGLPGRMRAIRRVTRPRRSRYTGACSSSSRSQDPQPGAWVAALLVGIAIPSSWAGRECIPGHAPRHRCGRGRADGHRARSPSSCSSPRRRGGRARRVAKARAMTQGRRNRARRQDDRGRARGAPRDARPRRGDRSALVRGPEEQVRAQRVEKAIADGAETVFVWGGDGMVQRCVDALAGTTLRARDPSCGHGQPLRLESRHSRRHRRGRPVGLYGRERQLDLGKMNGEHFAVMAGAGLDARMIRDVDGGRRTDTDASRTSGRRRRTSGCEPFKARIEVERGPLVQRRGELPALGNVGALFGGLEAFEGASPEDGRLELGVTHAESLASGREPSRVRRSARPRTPRSSRPRRRSGSTSSSSPRSSTSSTAGTARR